MTQSRKRHLRRLPGTPVMDSPHFFPSKRDISVSRFHLFFHSFSPSLFNSTFLPQFFPGRSKFGYRYTVEYIRKWEGWTKWKSRTLICQWGWRYSSVVKASDSEGKGPGFEPKQYQFAKRTRTVRTPGKEDPFLLRDRVWQTCWIFIGSATNWICLRRSWDHRQSLPLTA